jgi:hypothetical protein
MEDGYLTITDRIKELMKTSGGKYIAPQYVESTLAGDPYIEQLIVIADGRPYATALIVPAFDALEAYAKTLEAPMFGEHKGLRVLTGRDPALGPVILLGGRQGIGGARAAADTPGIRDLLETISAHGGDPDREGAW